MTIRNVRVTVGALALVLLLAAGPPAFGARPEGFDISHWNEGLDQSDFNTAYANDFVFCWTKATQGTWYTDPTLEDYMDYSYNAGIYTGCYHFAEPQYSTASAEATFFLNVAGDYVSGGYLRPVLDLEYGDSLSNSALATWANDWMDAVHAATGVEPIIYTGTWYAVYELDASIADRDLWIAQYWYQPEPQTGEPNIGVFNEWLFWQWTECGEVPGISTCEDANVFNGDMTALATHLIPGSPSGVPTYYCESRSGGKNYSEYSETGTWSNGSSKSTAAGCTAGIGHRYCTLDTDTKSASFAYTPSTSAVYEIYTTNCLTWNSGEPLIHKIEHAGGTAEVGVCQNDDCTSNAVNKWYSLGQYVLNASTEYEVILEGDTDEGSGPSGNAGRADAVKWEFIEATGGSPPSISGQPSDQDLDPGQTATFSVTASGTGTLTYQWQKDASNLSNGGDISGATSSSLTIEDVESADEGLYRCIVTDDNGSTTSNSAELTVSYNQWISVGTGIDYQQFRQTGDPENDIYVARLTRSNTNAIIDTTIADDGVIGNFEVMSSQASRNDGAITPWGSSGWGQTQDVVIATNGGYYNMGTGVITGGQCYQGWFAKRYDPSSGQSGFVFKKDRSCFVGKCTRHINANQKIVWVHSGVTQYITGLNTTRLSSGLFLYTPQYDYYTHTSGAGSEVVVQMDTSAGLSTSGILGTVVEIRENAGSTKIPFDCVVLSSEASDETTMLNNAYIGARVKIYQHVDPWTLYCQEPLGYSFDSAFSATNANHVYLIDSTFYNNGDAGFTSRNPRTTIAYNSTYIYLAVCDGRSDDSDGWTLTEMKDYMVNNFSVTDATNQDGGGSSEMIVNGAIQNVPSDGGERAVANGIVMVNIVAQSNSTTFSVGQTVTAINAANQRLGPGTNYYAAWSISAGAEGTIVAHDLNGVYAKGFNWWKCEFSGNEGWIAENLLEGGQVAPTIITHPGNASVVEGGTCSFTVVSTGGGLSYQWQKTQSDLSNGGHYSGVTTATLTVSNVDSSDEYNYRCIVTNDYGTATSNEASLTITTCTAGTLLNGSFESYSGGVGDNWTTYQRAPNPTSAWTIQSASPPDGGGTYYQQIANTSADGGGGVRQNITGCTVDYTYTVSGWMRTNSASATCTVKVSPSASTDWSTAENLSPAQSTTSSSWVAFEGAVTADSTSMTLWLDGHTGGTGLNKASCFDAISVSGCATPAAPTITDQPNPQTLCAAATAIFDVAATGPGTLTYQWQKDSSDLSNGGDISGVTTMTLVIEDVAVADEGNYRCKITNDGGTTTSNTAALTVDTECNTCLDNADAEGGFSLQGGGYIANGWTEWEEDSNVTTGYDETSVVYEGEHAQRIRVFGTEATSGGVYQQIPCTSSTQYTVTVYTRAYDTWSYCYLGVDPDGGTDASDGGISWSSANNTTSWVQKSVTVTSGASASNITVFYKVYASDFHKRNGYFDSATPACTDTIGPPTISSQPSNQTVCPASTTQFIVEVSGTGPFTYQWQADSSNLTDGGDFSGCTTEALTIENAATEDEASYRCIVTNDGGSVTSNTATLTVSEAACGVALLSNGSFEDSTDGVGDGWTTYTRATVPATVAWSIQTASPPTGGGTSYQQMAVKSASGGAGVRQDILGTTSGVVYTITGWYRTNSSYTAHATVKVSPTASTDWATAEDLDPVNTTQSTSWVPINGTVEAESSSMTLWLDGHTDGASYYKTACFDLLAVSASDVSLTNADFEGGDTDGLAYGWTSYTRTPAPATTAWTIQTASPPDDGYQYQQIANTSADGGGGVRQDITGCVDGATYTVSGWYRTNSSFTAHATVKVSPSQSTSWGTAEDLDPACTTQSTSWITFEGDVTADDTIMTLWLDGKTDGVGYNKAACFDAITVE